MANKVREEGDYTYWDDGAVRYARGNSLGKTPGALAKRPPYAAKLLHLQDKTNGKGKHGLTVSQRGVLAKRANATRTRELAKAAAEAGMLEAARSSSPSNPNVPTEAWGILAENLTERVLAEDNTGHAVAAVKQLGSMTGYQTQEKGQTVNIAQQVVVIAEERLGELDGVVEGEYREE